MSAPPAGFNPDTSLLQQNSSAPIVPFRGGGTPVSLEAFYQALLKTQSQEIRTTLPENIADITNFAISVEDGKFVLKMKVKGKKKGAVDEETAAAIADVEALEAATEAKEAEEAIATVEALKVANEAEKAEEEAAKKKAEEEEILKKAREFLILEAARAFLRNLGNDVSSEDGEANDEDRNEPVANNENNTPPLSNANIKRIKNSQIPPHLRGKQPIAAPAVTPPPKSKRSLNEIAAAAREKRPVSLSLPPSLSLDDQVRAETLEEAQRVVEEAKRLAKTQQGLVTTTPRGRRGTQVKFSPTLLSGTGVPATSKNVTEASRAAAQLTGTR